MNDVVRLPSSELEKPEKLIKRFEEDLKHVLDDPLWKKVRGNRRLRFREIDGVKIGVVLATYSEKYTDFALNCGETDLLRKGKSDGRVDLMVVVAVKGREWCGHAEAGELYERVLQHKTPIPGHPILARSGRWIWMRSRARKPRSDPKCGRHYDA